MTRAILHLGYPKTGTTYLQNRVLRQAADTMNLVTPTSENCGINIKSFKQEIERGEVRAETRARVMGRPALISIEGFLFDAMRFVEGDRFAPTDFARALAGLRSLCADLRPEDIAIVLYVRRQEDLVHSLYAESYTYQFSFVPALDSFEKYVDAVLGDAASPLHPGYYYDFRNTLAQIRQVFPEASVHLRFYEGLVGDPGGEIAFWSGLTGIALEHDQTRENVRAVNPGVKIADRSGLRVLAVRLKTRFLPGLKLPNALSQTAERILSRASFGAARQIELTEGMRVRLQDYFSAPNRGFLKQEGLLDQAFVERYQKHDGSREDGEASDVGAS